MAVETSTPVTEAQFFNRRSELYQLRSIVSDAKKGVRRWVALLGHRKIGKTRLLLEMIRKSSSRVSLPYIDCWEVRADPLQFMSQIIRSLIRVTVRKYGAESKVGPLETGKGDRYTAQVVQGLAKLRCPSIDEAVRLHEEVVSGKAGISTFRKVFDLPESVASDLGAPLVMIWDEFQELERLCRLRRLRGRIDDIFGMLRSLWQQHKRVSYIVAGSRLSFMRQIMTEEDSPFFQHFEMVNLGSFDRKESLRMLREGLNADDKISKSGTAGQILGLLGDHPFYLRALIQEMSPATAGKKTSIKKMDQALKEALEAALFEQNGRLSLFMEQRYRVAIGNSSTLESVLRGFVEPARITDVASRLQVRTGAVSSAVKMLMAEDIIVKRPDGQYALDDPTFALWLKHQVDFRNATPPLLVGSESEQIVAKRLAADGFRSVYQSRASRGSFDLLAIHDTRVFGLQVKTVKLPTSLKSQEMTRLLADARRLGFYPVLVFVVSGKVRFYDLQGQRKKHGLRIHENTRYEESLLSLL